MSSHLLYLRFKGLANAIQQGKGPEIDSIALQLLESIATAHSSGNSMRVSDALELKKLASYATLHKKLELLKQEGFVEVEQREGDYRSRYLVPSKAAIAFFDDLGRALLKVSKQSS